MIAPAECLYYRDPTESPSVADFVDRTTSLLVEAWDRGEDPERVVVSPRLHEILIESKAAEVASGMPLTVLGLFVTHVAQPGEECETEFLPEGEEIDRP